MNWKELLTDGYSRVSQVLERSLKGLTRDDLLWSISPFNHLIPFSQLLV